MRDQPGATDDSHQHDFLAGAGETRTLIRSFDWSGTALGPVDGWPQSLRTAVAIMLANQSPMSILWGPEKIQLYNDAYAPILGDSHPRAMGRRHGESTPGMWERHAEVFDRVLQTGEPALLEDELFLVTRGQSREETYLSVSCSAIPGDDGKTGGLLIAATDRTGHVLRQRRMNMLSALEARIRGAGGPEHACQVAAEIMSDNSHDIPFALFYLFDEDRTHLCLAATSGLEAGTPASPPVIELADADSSAWPLVSVEHDGKAVQVDDLEQRFGAIKAGPWSQPPQSALATPLLSPESRRSCGVLISGLNSHRPLDHEYQSFLETAAGHVAASLARLPPQLAPNNHGNAALESALKAAQAEKAHILDSIPDAYYALDIEWRFTDVNRRSEELWGKRRAELIGKTQWEVFPEEVGSTGYHEIHLAAREQRPVYYEALSPVVGMWVAADIYPTEQGVSVFWRDITKIKEAEETRVRFQALFDSAPSPYLVLKPDFTIAWVNEAYLRVTMTRREDILGREVFEAFPDNPGDKRATGVRNLRASLERVKRTGKPDMMAVQKYDIRRPASDGGGFEERYWSPVNAPVFGLDGELIYIIHHVTDVTDFIRLRYQESEQDRRTRELQTNVERAEAEVYMRAQELNKTNQLLRAANAALDEARGQAETERQRVTHILESIMEAFAALTRDYRFAYLNRKAAYEIRRGTGKRMHQIIGQSIWQLFPDLLGSQFEKECRRAAENDIPVHFEDFYPPLSLWFEVHAFPSEDGLAIYFQDITDRKQAEQERSRLAVLEERNRMAREIHDSLAQGLGGMVWHLNAMEATLVDGARQEVTDGLAALRDMATESLREARRTVLDLQPGPLEGATLVEALRAECDAMSRNRTMLATFNVIGDERPLPSATEAMALRICQEALANVIKHSAASEVVVTLEFVADGLRVTVQDNGVGFNVEPQDARRSDSGFGLINMKERAYIMKGALSVTSEPGMGTTVEVTLPFEQG
ncbi:MAG: PAS domain-containing protein [Dehalococcoidia bacterium]